MDNQQPGKHRQEDSAGPDVNGQVFIRDIADIRADMLPEVGGKAANLGELNAARLPVPPGFCLTTSAYRYALSAIGMEEIFALLQEAGASDLDELNRLAARARSLVLDAGVPTDVAESVRAAYRRLGDAAPVAVRSSATAEDLPFASFAGQQDTFLNVVGADAVLDAVSRCWASLWTDRAVSYRTTNGIDHATVTLAVVVQEMVDSATAGVMFTANPVTGRRREAVIDASPGLGEAVVSGAVNPDQYVVDMQTNSILKRSLGDRQVEIRSLAGGGTERIERAGQAAATENHAVQPCLGDDQIHALAELGRRVEAHYGAPQDTEWAIDSSGKLWLTQARPITTLYPLTSRVPATPVEHAFLNFSLAQGLTRPLTPMGLAGIRLIASSVARRAAFDVPDPRSGPSPYYEAGQRIFFDFTSVLRSKVGRVIVPRIFDIMEARSAAVIRGLFDDPRFAVTIKTPIKLIRHVAPVAAKYRVPESVVRALFRPDAAMKRQEQLEAELHQALRVPEGVSAHQRIAHVQRILGEEVFATVPQVLPLPVLGFAMLGLVRKLLGGQASWDQLQTVIRGLPNNVTTEMDLALWQLAKEIREDPEALAFLSYPTLDELVQQYKDRALPSVAQSGLEAFLRTYGHRAVAEIDLGMPRWSDDPTHILGVVVNYLRLEHTADAPDQQFGKAAREADEQVARLVARARAKSPLHAKLVRAALDRTRRFAGMRELPKYNLVLGLASAREQLSLVGAELAEAGRIENAEDIFFLDLNEVETALAGSKLHQLVADRRAEYAQELRRRHIPRVLLSDGTEPEATAAAGRTPASPGALSGSPASAGVITAPARVILDPVGAHLEPGEILVAPSTDPGWTPLFLTAGGLVMEMGGPNSHGAVVAREYGIPAVVGVPDATLRISSGQIITVDGAAGTVTATPSDAPG
ncbi:phosphoenolpyruvate synthase [Arthrobacter sp. StoSoilA2]|uniref:PEP/pyruvate-binding domain-containing protein n=1 Tax=Arthrobacter sp. StoSoilA2 TaxID=2830990 RepID=UPI001CC4BAC5|nr:PEP/pyruvate-binding domain-containing protein [Arthrobacter sp. StoSoilA2]BCW34302.1 phosphoenolpyruvate synthase [Arthrobacter sp. StoSoilA2]